MRALRWVHVGLPVLYAHEKPDPRPMLGLDKSAREGNRLGWWAEWLAIGLTTLFFEAEVFPTPKAPTGNG